MTNSNTDMDQQNSKAMIVIDVSKASCADGTIDLINQRIKQVINSGARLDDDDPRDPVNIIRWFDTETVTSITEEELEEAVANEWNGEC